MSPPLHARFTPVDDDVRRRAAGRAAADRHGALLVEAAAGTGKTTVLVERVLNIVRAGDQPLSKIAVVTFTEAAAAELKERLRVGVADLLAGDASDEASDETSDDGRDESTLADDERTRLRQALSDLEVAAVGTIHSFCMELLKQRPVEAGVDPGFKVADLFQQRILKSRAWETMLRSMRADEMSVDGRGLAAAHDLGLAHEPELRRIAFSLVDVECARLPQPELEALDWPTHWTGRWAAIGEALDRALRLAAAGGALAQRMMASMEVFAQLDPLPAREQQRALLADEFKVPLTGGTKKEEEAKVARAEAREALDALTAQLRHLRLTELAGWLSGLGEIYRQLAAREGWLDFDSLIRIALDTLRTQPHVLADFQRSYPVLLVDEFQDTDPLQTELLLLLAGSPRAGELASAAEEDHGPRGLFLVGDPKQSIYRFRGADLENYNRVLSEALGPERQVVLRQSFRPLPALAAWVNEVMARAMRPAGGGAELASYEAPYRELVAREPEAAPELGGVLYLEIDFKLSSDGSADASTVGGVEAAREAEAEGWARLIHRLVGVAQVRDRRTGDLRPATHGDIALLLPKLTMLDTYERVFHRWGIPFRVIGGRHYYRRDEVHALLSILRALADPGDPVAVVAALRGPGFAASDAALAAWALCRPRPRFEAVPGGADPDLSTSPDPERAREVSAALALLRALYRETVGLPLPELVERALDRTGLLPFFALQWRGEQRVANLRKVVEVARRVEAAGVGELSAFIRWLEGLLEEEPEESDSPYLEGAGAAVRVMTVHRAKGLEFPIVLLGGLPSGSGRGGNRLRVFETGGERLALYLSSKCATQGAHEARERDRLREAAETRRLLYVATTRARDLLVLPFQQESGVRQGDLFQTLYADGVGRPEAVEAPHHRWVAADLPMPPEHDTAGRVDPSLLLTGGSSAQEIEHLRRRDAALAVAGTAPALGLLRPSDREALPAPEPGIGGELESQAARRAAFRIGDAAHLLLEAELSGSSFDAARLPARLTPTEERTARELAGRFLGSNLYIRARAAGSDKCFAELTLTLAVASMEEPVKEPMEAGTILDGQVDLAFLEAGVHGEDGWVIVDYKTDRLEPGDEASRALAYAGQLALYAQALAEISHRPVREVHLFFLATGEAVLCPVAAPADRSTS